VRNQRSQNNNKTKTNMKNYSIPLRLILRLLCIASILVSADDTFAEPVIDWNVAMTSYSESLPPPGMPPYIEARIYAMAHIAMLRAVTGNDADAARPFSKTAAIAQAAHDVLVDQFPGGASAFDNLLTKQLARSLMDRASLPVCAWVPEPPPSSLRSAPTMVPPLRRDLTYLEISRATTNSRRLLMDRPLTVTQQYPNGEM
jgi:hypothetical protein